MIKMSASRKLQGADGVSQQQTNLGMALYYPAITPNPMQQSKGTIGDPLMSVHERHRCLELSNESWPGARARRAPCCRTTVRAAAPAGARPSARLPPSDANTPPISESSPIQRHDSCLLSRRSRRHQRPRQRSRRSPQCCQCRSHHRSGC